MPFRAKCFTSLSLCLFLPTQKPSRRCLWEKLYLFLAAVGLYSQRQHSKYTASCNSSKYPPNPRATTGLSTRDLWPSKRCLPVVGRFHREGGKDTWKAREWQKKVWALLQTNPDFSVSHEDCHLLQKNAPKFLISNISINTKLLDAHSSGFRYMKTISPLARA